MNKTTREMLNEIERLGAIEKERLSKLTRKEQIEEEIAEAKIDYKSCAMAGNFEGMEECSKDIGKLRKELEREAE